MQAFSQRWGSALASAPEKKRVIDTSSKTPCSKLGVSPNFEVVRTSRTLSGLPLQMNTSQHGYLFQWTIPLVNHPPDESIAIWGV